MVTLLLKVENSQEPLDFSIRVEWPDTGVVPSLVFHARSCNVEFHTYAVSVAGLEELASLEDRCYEGVFGVVDASRGKECLFGQFPEIYFLIPILVMDTSLFGEF